jgi:hypothetical protein
MQFHKYTNNRLWMPLEYRRSTGQVQRLFYQPPTFSTRSSRVQFPDQRTQQTPEMIFTGIAANASDLLALFN